MASSNDENWSIADEASQRRTSGGGVRSTDPDRSKARRRHRHHHRIDAGLELPVAAHGRQIRRRLHPRSRRRRGRGARSRRQRGDGAEDRSSAVSGRGGRDEECRQRLQSRRGRAAEAPGDARRQGLSGGADADLVSGLVAGNGGAGVGISRSGTDDDPEPADRPCGADRDCRAAVGLARPAPDRSTPDQGGGRDQACRALRSGQGRAASVAADRDREPFGRDRRHGAGAGRVPQIYSGRSGEAPDQRRQRRAPRRRGAADERDVHRSRRLHRHVGAARRPHHSAIVALFRFRLDADSSDRRHHRQIHRRCRDGVLGCAGAESRSRRRLLPRRAGLPARRWRKLASSTITASR